MIFYFCINVGYILINQASAAPSFPVWAMLVWFGLLGAAVSGDQRLLISWFGIRGIGSIYYLMFALNHGLSGEIAGQAISITLSAIAASIIIHGISVTPLMAIYSRRQLRKSQRAPDQNRRNETR